MQWDLRKFFAEAVETNKDTVETNKDIVDVADAEFQRKRIEKGKVHNFEESSEQQSRKISKSEQAQIDYDANLALELEAVEVAKKKKQEELDIASFM
jgi:hypothetical protein